MSSISSLKLVTSSKNNSVDSVSVRRSKLITKINEQISICLAKKEGNLYIPKRLKVVTDETTGEKKTIEQAKRVKEWFWIGANGKINLAIKYGSKTLILNKKGANAIEVSNIDELVTTLKTMTEAVSAGELDDSINDASSATREAFKK
jgi:hypothetical protein